MVRNRTIAAAAAVLYLGAYFTATRPITRALAAVSGLSVILFALPSYAYAVKAKGWRAGLPLLALLGLFALGIESVALATGFPYGYFTYTDVLGNKLFGLTPWTVAFAYPPVLLLAYCVARRMKPEKNLSVIRLAAVSALLTTMVDLVLDPAAVRLGFWRWDEPGFYYGVPLQNFLGWFVVSFWGGLILHRLWGREEPAAVLAYSGMAVLWFWTSVNLWLHHWVAGLFGMILSIYLVRIVKYKAATMKR